MIADGETPLAEQNLLLRAQLKAQRQKVEQKLAPAAVGQGHYPRSVTMRLLMRRPDLALRLFAGAARLLRAK